MKIFIGLFLVTTFSIITTFGCSKEKKEIKIKVDTKEYRCVER